MKAKILVIDDDPDMCALLADALGAAGYDVTWRLDAEEGAELLRQRDVDLFYRLNVVQIHIPPLRARGNDVILLADHFVQRYASRSKKPVIGLDPEAQRKLLAFDWPGNVRQLENTIERAVALTRSDRIQVEDLPERVTRFDASAHADIDLDLEHVLTLDQIERRQIERSIRQHHGNKTRAAKALGIDRRTLYRKLERYDGAPPLPTMLPGKLERVSGI